MLSLSDDTMADDNEVFSSTLKYSTLKYLQVNDLLMLIFLNLSNLNNLYST